MIRRPFLRPVAALLGVLCLVSGCHSWKQEPLSAPSLSQRQLASARVRTVDGRRMTIFQPRVVGDSLVGRRDAVGPGPASQHPVTWSVPVSVAMAQVSSVETRHLTGLKTSGVALAVLAVVGLGVLSTLRVP